MITADRVIANAIESNALIRDLLAQANETTGQSDTNLMAAVNHLKDGYGQGGGDTETAYEQGLSEGKELTVGALSSAVQQNGQRTNYDDTFNGSSIDDDMLSALLNGWNSTIKQSNNMFRGTQNVTDGAYNEKLDFSLSTSLNSAFASSTVTKLKKIDARSTLAGWNGMANMFYNCKNLVSIDEFYPSTMCKFSGTFLGCENLEKIMFMSEIAQDSLSFHNSSKLSKDSIESLINALSTETSGLTVTLSQEAVDKIHAAEDVTTWFPALAETRPNWTISLV